MAASTPHKPAPLAGATVVVTRPAASAAALKRRIVAMGGRVIGLPGNSVRAARDAEAARRSLRAARDADAVIFVSPAAVRFAFALLPTLRFKRATQLCAVGAASARALARRGLRDVASPRQRQDSEGLLALPALQRTAGRRVVLVGAPGGRDLLARMLGERGAQVVHAHVYERGPARLTRQHRDALATARAPLFVQWTSLDAMTHLRAQLAADLFERLVDVDAIVSSARIADAARALGTERVHLAASANAADLVAATAAALAKHRL